MSEILIEMSDGSLYRCDSQALREMKIFYEHYINRFEPAEQLAPEIKP